MGDKKDYKGPAEAFDRYAAAIDLVEGVTRKGAANPYTSANERMATYLGRRGEVAIRLGKDELEHFLVEQDTERPVSYGAVMQHFALVPDAIVADPGRLADLIRRAHAHVEALPPK